MKAFIYRRKSQEDKGRQALSFENQHRAIARLLDAHPDLEVIEDFEEARTAAKPGRPLFNEMLRRIEAGEASAIIAYGPDRLSRNAVDAGRIVDMLDRGMVKDLAFCTYGFENSPAGKFMLQMMLVQSKYYSDALAVNVREGLATKLANGWQPGRVPLGYQHDRNAKTVVRNPEHFELVRRMFTMTLAGTHSPRQICDMAREQWGLLTPKSARKGGTPITLSAVYKILSNPFYAGLIRWKGRLHPGKQEPMLSLADFEAVQQRLGRAGTARPERHQFPFTGLIRCACSLMITAEQKAKNSGRTYTYYRCTRRKGGGQERCRQPAIPASDLEEQMRRFLMGTTLHPEICDWLLRMVNRAEASGLAFNDARRGSIDKALGENRAQLTSLTRLRVRDMIDDTEFLAERERLDGARLRLEEEALEAAKARDRIEPVRDVIWLSNKAVEWFGDAENAARRLIFETVGSNPVLAGKKLNVQAAKPFRQLALSRQFLQWCGIGEDVRTLPPEFGAWLDEMMAILEEPESKRLIRNVRLLRECLEETKAEVA